jgi:predicted nucleotidyltransferase
LRAILRVVIGSARITTTQAADVTMRLVDERAVAAAIQQAVDALRDVGAKFGYLHGSRVTGSAGSDSDIDIAAYFGDNAPAAFEVPLPPGVDLLVLDHAPLELAGRISLRGRLLFEDDVVARVRWEATTRKIYFDELPRIVQSHREFVASHRRG